MSWLAKLFKKELAPIPFDDLGCDMHSHFIPGIDDGSPDMETTISLIKKSMEMGFKKIITTPHVMSDFYKNTPEIILSGLEAIRKELKNQSIDIEIDAAAEYYVDFDFTEELSEKKFLTFGDNNLLIETSFIAAPPNFEDIIFQLQLAKYKVVFAHPERYLFMSIKDLQKLKFKSVDLQMNLLSLIGYYGKEVQLRAEKLIQLGLVDYVGTDCHNLSQAGLYHKCFGNKHWQELLQNGNLKNKFL